MLQRERKQHQADTEDIQGKLTQALLDKEYAETHQKTVTKTVERHVVYEKCNSCAQTELQKSKEGYDRAWKRLDGEFKAKTIAFEGAFGGFVVYALFVTVLMAVRTQSFIDDVVVFFQTIWEGTMESARWILFVGKYAATLSKKVSNANVSNILHWVLLIGMIVILAVGIIAAIWFVMKWISSIYKKYCWDGISVMVVIMSAAFVIFFGDWAQRFISMNQVVILLLIQGIYMIIRWYVKGCMENRGRY